MVSERERERWERAIHHVFSERRMTALALLILPMLFIELTVDLTPEQLTVMQLADWAIYSVFVAEFTSKLYIAKSKWESLTRNKFETILDIIIVFSPLALVFSPVMEFAPTAPVLRLARELMLARLLKVGAYTARGAMGLKKLSAAFYEHKFYHYALLTGIATLIGSSFIFRLEHGVNPYFGDYWAALWWSLVTVLTVGGMAATPMTSSGRLVAGGLMVIGIGFVAVLTANIAAFFIEHHGEEERAHPLQQRVNSLYKRTKEMAKELHELSDELKEIEERKQ